MKDDTLLYYDSILYDCYDKIQKMIEIETINKYCYDLELTYSIEEDLYEIGDSICNEKLNKKQTMYLLDRLISLYKLYYDNWEDYHDILYEICSSIQYDDELYYEYLKKNTNYIFY